MLLAASAPLVTIPCGAIPGYIWVQITNYREAHPGSQTALKSLCATLGDSTALACPGNSSAETLRCSSTQTIKNTVWASKRKARTGSKGGRRRGMKAALLCEAAWGKCDGGSAIPLERLEKGQFPLFLMFHPVLPHFFCPAPQSLTLIVRGKLGWRLSCLLGWIFFPLPGKELFVLLWCGGFIRGSF